MGKKTNKKWIRPIHKFGRALVYFAVYPFVKLKYRATIKNFPEENGGQYIILYNHQTPFDQFFVGMSLKGLVYYVCSDDVMCKGFISKVINFVVAPIPIKKHSSDARAIMNMLKVLASGGASLVVYFIMKLAVPSIVNTQSIVFVVPIAICGLVYIATAFVLGLHKQLLKNPKKTVETKE